MKYFVSFNFYSSDTWRSDFGSTIIYFDGGSISNNGDLKRLETQIECEYLKEEVGYRDVKMLTILNYKEIK